MNLHLGCGTQRLDGFVNCDFKPYAGVTDMVFDLMQPWPLPDNAAQFVLASHVLEHLPDFAAFFRELWRVCAEHALCHIRVPYGGSRAAWSDPTHVRPWYPESFCHLQPGYAEYVHNLQYMEDAHPFHVLKTQTMATPAASTYIKLPLLGKFIFNHAEWFPEFFGELIVFLQPIKTEGKLLEFQTYGTPGYITNELLLHANPQTPKGIARGPAWVRKEGWTLKRAEQEPRQDQVWKRELIGMDETEVEL